MLGIYLLEADSFLKTQKLLLILSNLSASKVALRFKGILFPPFSVLFDI